MPESKPKKREEEAQDTKKDAYAGFNAMDRALTIDNPEYGEKLSKIKQGYNEAQTDEERQNWHNEAEKLSNAYGYSRSADGSRMTRLEGNLNTIKRFDSANGKDDKSGYQSVINALLGDIAGAKFKYDAKSDPRYALAQDYAKDAMRNQMAESAALTGGYGNSYSAAAGQQVYDDYMEGAVDNLKDRAYSRYRDEQSDRYQRLNALIGLEGTVYNRELDRENTEYNRRMDAENTAYSRTEAAKSDARARIQTMLASGSAPEDILAELKAASGLTDAEIAAMYSGVQSSLYASGAEAARNRVDAYIQNGGDPSNLPADLLAQSGYTDAEIQAARESVLESIRQQRYKVYGGGSSGQSSTDNASGAAADNGDMNGLFYAAYAASERKDGDITTAEEYIAKNYKAFGFSSANGLVEQYRSTMSPNGDIDVSQADANAYLQENGIAASAALSKKQFYAQDNEVGGVKYDTYADYIDAIVDGKISVGAKRQEFRNALGGYLSTRAKK